MEIEFILRLSAAALLGAVLGFERSLAGKHAGMRTYALVSLGSALFTLVGVIATYQFAMFPGINPLHLAGFVLVGIGFIGSGLGGGFGSNHPVEITTAAGIWVVAAVGVASGFGYFGVAIMATIFAILIFSVFARIEHRLGVRFSKNYQKSE